MIRIDRGADLPLGKNLFNDVAGYDPSKTLASNKFVERLAGPDVVNPSFASVSTLCGDPREDDLFAGCLSIRDEDPAKQVYAALFAVCGGE